MSIQLEKIFFECCSFIPTRKRFREHCSKSVDKKCDKNRTTTSQTKEFKTNYIEWRKKAMKKKLTLFLSKNYMKEEKKRCF